MRKLKRTGLLTISIICTQYVLALDIIPYPLKVEPRAGVFNLAASTVVLYSSNCQQEADFFLDVLKKKYNLPIEARLSKPQPAAGSITLNVDTMLAGRLGKEGYDLTVGHDQVQIS